MKLLFLLGLIALGAALTRPTLANVETKLGAVLHDEIARGQIDMSQNAPEALLLAACKSKPDLCANLARDMMTLEYRDYRLFALADIRGFGKQTQCVAAFTQILCPFGLRDQ